MDQLKVALLKAKLVTREMADRVDADNKKSEKSEKSEKSNKLDQSKELNHDKKNSSSN